MDNETTAKESSISKTCGLQPDTTTTQATPVKISQQTVKAMILDAEASYKEEFERGNLEDAMWFDGHLRALYRILEYNDQ